MKEMPERIYLFDCNDAITTPLEGDTEYIRKDSFIEKAVNFIAENLSKGTTERLQTKVKFIHNFKKYLEEQI